MKEYKTVSVPQRQVTKRICDWCKEEITDTKYNVPQANIEFKIESHVYFYGNGSEGEVWGIEDLCSDCGLRLKKVLSSMGIEIYEYEW